MVPANTHHGKSEGWYELPLATPPDTYCCPTVGGFLLTIVRNLFEEIEVDNETKFGFYWDRLLELARQHGEHVADKQAWKEDFDEGKSAEDAFYGEYPEHRPPSK